MNDETKPKAVVEKGFMIQKLRAGKWLDFLDTPTEKHAIETRNHLTSTRRERFRAVKTTVEIIQ